MMVEVVFFVRRTCSQERADEALNYPCTPERAIFSGATFLPSLLYYSTPIGNLTATLCVSSLANDVYLLETIASSKFTRTWNRSKYVQKATFQSCVSAFMSVFHVQFTPLSEDHHESVQHANRPRDKFE